jgi:hypothetical protein
MPDDLEAPPMADESAINDHTIFEYLKVNWDGIFSVFVTLRKAAAQ